MKKLLFSLVALATLLTLPKFAFCQDKAVEPFIVSIVPDSLFTKYDYSQTVFIPVSVASTFGKDPTGKAIQDLQKMILETCKLNKMDGFILNQIIFAKPFEEGKLIGYGTMIRLKKKQPK